jgi:O-glycosyl hydrolase
LWALGNYSRFIRPGAKRISVEMGKSEDLRISAWKNKDKTLTVVVLNRGVEPRNIQFQIVKNGGKHAKKYETSENSNLSFKGSVDLTKPLIIPKESISTFVISQ